VQGAFAPGAVGISLIKGIEFKDSKPILISDLLAAEMKKVHPLSMLHPLTMPHPLSMLHPLTMPHPSCHTPPHAHLHPPSRPPSPSPHPRLTLASPFSPSPSRPPQGPNAPDVDMSVLMGANVANEVATGGEP